MISYLCALAKWIDRVPVVGEEELQVEASDGRVLASDVFSNLAVPPFDTSAMDGWALRLGDLPREGGELPVAARINAAPGERFRLPKGAAAKVMTGAPLPEGAEGVVPVEEAEDRGERVLLRRAPTAGEHFRLAGAIFEAGSRLARAGEIVTPRLLALLVSGTTGAIALRRRPVAAVLATGDELAAAGSPLRPGEIRNSNGPFLRSALLCEGAEVRHAAGCVDGEEELGRELERLSGPGSGVDLLLTSGGVSMGDRDLVATALEKIGAELLFHRVAIRPGKPLLAARRNGTMILALPGNPVSVSVGWELFGRPALRKMTGRPEPPPRWARLAAPARGDAAREYFADARLGTEGESLVVTPLSSKGSHDLATHAAANALVRLPVGAKLDVGTLVEYLPLPGI
jgi:molybdopterin molybdotransferase